jgi:hypothetical protein
MYAHSTHIDTHTLSHTLHANQLRSMNQQHTDTHTHTKHYTLYDKHYTLKKLHNTKTSHYTHYTIQTCFTHYTIQTRFTHSHTTHLWPDAQQSVDARFLFFFDILPLFYRLLVQNLG